MTINIGMLVTGTAATIVAMFIVDKLFGKAWNFYTFFSFAKLVHQMRSAGIDDATIQRALDRRVWWMPRICFGIEFILMISVAEVGFQAFFDEPFIGSCGFYAMTAAAAGVLMITSAPLPGTLIVILGAIFFLGGSGAFLTVCVP